MGRRKRWKDPRQLKKQELIDAIINRAIEMENYLEAQPFTSSKKESKAHKLTKYRLTEDLELIELLRIGKQYRQRKGFE